MTKQQLLDILASYNLTIATERLTTGNERAGFYTYEIGVGAPFGTLRKACTDICAAWNLPSSVAKDFCRVGFVVSPEHEDHGKPYLRVESFWTENATN
jgi:hypothetical protein